MPDALTLDHNGHTLQFNEKDESWSCWQMKMNASSLKALKAKLDKHDGQVRKITLPVYLVDHYGKSVPAEIVMIAKPKDWERNYTTSGSNAERSPTVWVTRQDGNKTERKKVRLDACVSRSVENMNELTMAAELRTQAAVLEAKARAIINDIPRLTLEELTAKDVVEDNLEETES